MWAGIPAGFLRRNHRRQAPYGGGDAECRRRKCRQVRRNARRASRQTDRRSVAWGALSGSGPQRPPRGDGCAVGGYNGARERTRSLYLLTYPARVRDDELGSERNRLVNSERVVNQRFGEFGTEIRGSGRNPQGSFLNPGWSLCETEIAGPAAESSQTVAAQAQNAKRPAADLSGPGVNWLGAFVRRKSNSSPGRTRTYDKPVNSRLLYQLSYRGIQTQNGTPYPATREDVLAHGCRTAAQRY